MRKLFLFGTALCVATSVWAFGGIGIGPWQRHKSNSGVDAIGIHIDPNGKKADIDIVDGDSQEDTCPVEKQCGTTCCGDGNICVDGNKCCHKDYNGDESQCCNANESAGYSPYDGCCVNGAKPFYNTYEPWYDYGELVCCDGIGFLAEQEPGEYGIRLYACCPIGSVGVSNIDGCCEQGTIIIANEEGGDTHCCPAGSTGWQDEPEGRCCTQDEILVRSSQTDEDLWFCCPEGSTDWVDGECI